MNMLPRSDAFKDKFALEKRERALKRDESGRDGMACDNPLVHLLEVILQSVAGFTVWLFRLNQIGHFVVSGP